MVRMVGRRNGKNGGKIIKIKSLATMFAALVFFQDVASLQLFRIYCTLIFCGYMFAATALSSFRFFATSGLFGSGRLNFTLACLLLLSFCTILF